MPKLTKRIVDALQHDRGRDVFVWDTEVRGFGIRAKPSGTKTFLIQYRNAERRGHRRASINSRYSPSIRATTADASNRCSM